MLNVPLWCLVLPFVRISSQEYEYQDVFTNSTIQSHSQPELTTEIVDLFGASHNEASTDKICSLVDSRYLTQPAGISHLYLTTYSPYMECCLDHPISNQTKALYDILSECLRRTKNCVMDASTLTEMASNYINAVLVMAIIRYGYAENMRLLVYAFDRVLDFFEKQANSRPQLSCLSSVSRLFLEDPLLTKAKIYIGRNFIHIIFPIVGDILGYVVYRQGQGSFLNYSIRPITFENATRIHSNNKDVEVAFYLDRSNYRYTNTEQTMISAFIYYSKNFTEYRNYATASRILGLQTMIPVTSSLNVKVYLKRIDNNGDRTSIYKEGGDWFTLTLSNGTFVLSFIYEPSNDVRDSTSQLLIRHTYVEAKKHMVKQNAVPKKNITKLDFLSQLVVQVNVETRELHLKHSNILGTISFCLGVLSVLGLLSIFISFIMIKDWHKKRFCSIQLSIATTGEAIFFLMRNMEVGHVGYVIFYYFILAQFAWMAIIGYVQYNKFIKIFRTSKLGILKPLAFGWLVPLAITAGLIFSHVECFECNLCSKNASIFTNFIMLPMSFVIICNLVIYIYVVVNISRDTSHMTPKVMKARLRAILTFPFILGISWIFILAIKAPWAWLSFVGSYFFHIIAPSQGIVLFVFVIILNENTTAEWYSCTESIVEAKCHSNNVVI